ncbi:TetR/AcrR family transcriptional regulator [Microlunatus sp. Y2014]|uniref:TetR/AcrR family transcriptional regulator n=1 Tax=Microlunatus sp. Y2014 TaxID=3418488 RepID=UPI003DA6FE6D
MTGARALAHAEMDRRIRQAARQELATAGGAGLSMRAVAREVGMVSSAIYRYYPTREALLTAMIIESYHALGSVLAATADDDHADAGARWAALAETLRTWALEHPHEFQLIYGTPIPGYRAPAETVPAAAAVAQPFLDCAALGIDPAMVPDDLVAALAPAGEALGVRTETAAGFLAALSQLVGMITLELGGHFVGVTDDPAALHRATVITQRRTLGLPPPAPRRTAARRTGSARGRRG